MQLVKRLRPRNLPPLSEEQIFRWAKAHFSRTGKWPHNKLDKLKDAPGETWIAIDIALVRGTRGLAGESSLAQLLDQRGEKQNPQRRLPLTVKQVLALADKFHKAHGYWPYKDSGPIEDLPGQSWMTIEKALNRGTRGLPSGRTLAGLLNEHRGIFDGRRRRLKRIP